MATLSSETARELLISSYDERTIDFVCDTLDSNQIGYLADAIISDGYADWSSICYDEKIIVIEDNIDFSDVLTELEDTYPRIYNEWCEAFEELDEMDKEYYDDAQEWVAENRDMNDIKSATHEDDEFLTRIIDKYLC